MLRRWFVAAVALASCTVSNDDPRVIEIGGVFARADEALLRARPALVAGKYATMANDDVAFFRGSIALYRHAARDGRAEASSSRYALEEPLVPSLGDAHPENFGTLLAPDGTLALEPNDFDAADDAPYLWDVRRLACGMALAASVSNPDDAAAREKTSSARHAIALRATKAYVRGLDAALDGQKPRITASGGVILDDLFARAERDRATHAELDDFTALDGTTRRLKRGRLSPDDAQKLLVDLPEPARASLAATLAEYRTTLLEPPDSGFFTPIDAARELGSGVASWPRVRVIVLCRGPSDAPDDDVLLEVKELADSGIAGLTPPYVAHDSIEARVRNSSRNAWARPDAAPLWGTASWLGMPVQIRQETQAHKTIRIGRMTGERGTTTALGELSDTLGLILSRVHSSRGGAGAIRDRIGHSVDDFAEEQATFADACATQSLSDRGHFVRALRLLGLRLGVPIDPTDVPPPDVAALFGSPPPPSELAQ